MRLVVENVSKEYRGGAQGVRALSNVGFSLGPGVLGLLGPGERLYTDRIVMSKWFNAI